MLVKAPEKLSFCQTNVSRVKKELSCSTPYVSFCPTNPSKTPEVFNLWWAESARPHTGCEVSFIDKRWMDARCHSRLKLINPGVTGAFPPDKLQHSGLDTFSRRRAVLVRALGPHTETSKHAPPAPRHAPVYFDHSVVWVRAMLDFQILEVN